MDLVGNERVTFISHENHRVLLLDFSEAQPGDVSVIIERASSIIEQAAPKSLLTLTDVTSVVVRNFSTRQMVDFVSRNKPFVKAAAIIGLSGITRSILATTNVVTGRHIKAFDTRERALKWLICQ